MLNGSSPRLLKREAEGGRALGTASLFKVVA